MSPRASAKHADRRLYLLVLRCQTGDETAFAQLLASFGGRTRATCAPSSATPQTMCSRRCG